MRNARRWISILVGVAAVGLVLFLNRSSNMHSWQAPKSEMREAPNFKLKDSQGKEHQLSDYQGKVILLHFWASWCPPCLEEIPRWLKLAEHIQAHNRGLKPEAKSQAIQMIAISIDQNWDDAQKILSDQAASQKDIVSLLDSDSKISEAFGSYQYPETYYLNSEHKIFAKWVGPQDWDNPTMVEQIEKAASHP